MKSTAKQIKEFERLVEKIDDKLNMYSDIDIVALNSTCSMMELGNIDSCVIKNNGSLTSVEDIIASIAYNIKCSDDYFQDVHKCFIANVAVSKIKKTSDEAQALEALGFSKVFEYQGQNYVHTYMIKCVDIAKNFIPALTTIHKKVCVG